MKFNIWGFVVRLWFNVKVKVWCWRLYLLFKLTF